MRPRAFGSPNAEVVRIYWHEGTPSGFTGFNGRGRILGTPGVVKLEWLPFMVIP